MGELSSVAISAITKSEPHADTVTATTHPEAGESAPCASLARHATEASARDREDTRRDHFTRRDGVECAGIHMILDLYGASHLDDLHHMERAFRDAVDEAGATLLHIHLHHFTPNAGVSGVAVLAESHISVHTWPERNYAAFDIFMCGSSQPERAIEVFKRAFAPSRVRLTELLRGITGEEAEGESTSEGGRTSTAVAESSRDP